MLFNEKCKPAKLIHLLFLSWFISAPLAGMTQPLQSEYESMKEDFYNRAVDSLRNIMETVTPEELVKLYPQIHNTLYALDDLELHLEFNDLYAQAARKSNNKGAEALSRGFRVEVFCNHRQSDSIVMAQAAEAMDFMRGIPDAVPYYFYTATIMTDVLIMSGKYDDALKMAEKFYCEAQEIDHISGIAGSLHSMAKAYEGLELYDKAAASFREAISNTTETKGAGIACESYTLLGNVLNQLGRYDEALQTNKDFEAFLDRRQSQTGNRGELENIRFINDVGYAKTYTNLGEYSLAEEYIFRAESAPPYGTGHGKLLVEEVKFALLLEQGKYAEAEASLYRMDENYMDNARFHEQLRQKERRTELYHRWGIYDKAADHYKEYINLKDSLQRVEMATRLNSIRTQYEVDRLEMQRERQKGIIRSGLILLIVILAALAVVGFLYGKNRQAYLVLAEKARQWADSDVALTGSGQSPAVHAENSDERDITQEEVYSEDEKVLGDKLSAYILKYKPYVDPELTLERLSEMLAVNRSKLSRVINRTTGKIFKQYINELRVSEAIRLMDDPQSRSLSMDQLMEQAGFNSRSAFYESFKKITGLTPAQYWRSIKLLQ